MPQLWLTALPIPWKMLAAAKCDDKAISGIPAGLFRMVSLLPLVFIGGCSDVALLDPKGPIGDTERFVIIVAFILMLIVVIPVFIMAFWFPLKYRADKNAVYTPKWSYSGKIELIMWLIPAAIVIGLSVLTWNTTYQLDPYKPINPDIKPVNIEAVSLDWKWLFIYPDENIAVVNLLVFPVNVPLSFRITSDTVMTSFFIPRLGSQIYAMAGMQTRLHLLADEPGTYAGHNQQFSGKGYADMNFQAIAVSPEQFQVWLRQTRKAKKGLNLPEYQNLQQPTKGYPLTYFSSVMPDLFNAIIYKYNKSSGKEPDAEPAKTNGLERD